MTVLVALFFDYEQLCFNITLHQKILTWHM